VDRRAAAERRRIRRGSGRVNWERLGVHFLLVLNRVFLIEMRLGHRAGFHMSARGIAPAPAPIRADPRGVAPDVFLNGKPPGARAPSNSRTPLWGPTPAPGSVPPCGQIIFSVRIRSKIRWRLKVEGYAGTSRPKSARAQRPVRQRHKSVASWRAKATTVFLRRAVPVVIRAMSLRRACQRG
jgi:hypothetical protein